jgi:ABC-type glycerol-3-phosphate transport system permease component
MMEYVNQALDFLREGFHQVNAIEGLIIALLAAYMMRAWDRLLYVALGATIANLIADVLLPVIVNNTPFQLPDMVDKPYWRHAAALYVGYLVVVAVFFFLKKNVLRGDMRPAH